MNKRKLYTKEWNKKFYTKFCRLPEYMIWTGMRQRCSNPKNPEYRRYGGIGRKVCTRWDSWANFFQDMGFRPSREHTIERIDNELGYTPDNCKWATQNEQNANRRPDPHTIYIEHEGVKYTFTELSKKYGIDRNTLRARHRRGKHPITFHPISS